MNTKYHFDNSIKCNGYRTVILVLVIFQVAVFSSCKKLVEVNAPITSLTGKNVYTDDATAASVLTGIYATMGSGQIYSGSNGISLRTGLCADELILSSAGFNGGILQQSYQNNFSAQQAPDFWQLYHSALLTVNSAIEGLQNSGSLTPAVKTQLLGEAKFLRAFFHFYLVNFYGDIPLTTSSDWRTNDTSSRTSKNVVYEQIISDLIDAQALLSEKYVKADAMTVYTVGSEERIRPTKWAAKAFLARVYLYTADWPNAEAQASDVINKATYYNLNSLESAFSKNNPEAIWQIQYVNDSWGTEGFHLILTEEPGYSRPAYLSSFLLNAFEAGDNRKSKWIDSFKGSTNVFYYSFKYKAQTNPDNTEYLMVLRLAEQYLIRAEAKAQQNKISEAQTDLNIIRQRANLLPTGANDKNSLLGAILHERQVELFTEWGHRWFDLIRTANINAVMNSVYPAKKAGSAWDKNWQLLPIPFNDIKLNPHLAPNNPGY